MFREARWLASSHTQSLLAELKFKFSSWTWKAFPATPTPASQDMQIPLTITTTLIVINGFPGGSVVSLAMEETWVWSLGQEDPLEKEMATYSISLPWEIPWWEEPGGLQFTGPKELDATEHPATAMMLLMAILSQALSKYVPCMISLISRTLVLLIYPFHVRRQLKCRGVHRAGSDWWSQDWAQGSNPARLGSKPQHCCFQSEGSGAQKKSKTVEAQGTEGRGEKVGTVGSTSKSWNSGISTPFVCSPHILRVPVQAHGRQAGVQGRPGDWWVNLQHQGAHRMTPPSAASPPHLPNSPLRLPLPQPVFHWLTIAASTLALWMTSSNSRKNSLRVKACPSFL